MIPDYWKQFTESNNLVGQDFEIDENSDLSELGADFRIMTFEQCLSEATECYPGIAAVKKGFVPVGMCLEGSGDYYYINCNDGESGSLYRIYHDSIEGDQLSENGIDKVLESYKALLSQ